LSIDAPAARSAVGLTQKVSDADRAKIRETMLGAHGLDAARYPLIAFRSTEVVPEARQEEGRWLVTGELSLHGVTKVVHLTVLAAPEGAGARFTGELRIKPSEYGMKPFKAAGGLVKVKDDALLVLDFFGKKR
jgi:polyisoprenoid-binding protein YceI